MTDADLCRLREELAPIDTLPERAVLTDAQLDVIERLAGSWEGAISRERRTYLRLLWNIREARGKAKP